MESRIVVSTEATGEVIAVVTDENPKAAYPILSALPMKGTATRWGDEIYFPIPINLNEENARVEVEVGSVAYWPPGHALCIFFGATPASLHGEPRAYSPVNVFAKVVGDASVFKKVRDNDLITLSKFKH